MSPILSIRGAGLLLVAFSVFCIGDVFAKGGGPIVVKADKPHNDTAAAPEQEPCKQCDGLGCLFVDVTCPAAVPSDFGGNVQVIFLTFVYGYVLFTAANLISDGSELLLLVRRSSRAFETNLVLRLEEEAGGRRAKGAPAFGGLSPLSPLPPLGLPSPPRISCTSFVLPGVAPLPTLRNPSWTTGAVGSCHEVSCMLLHHLWLTSRLWFSSPCCLKNPFCGTHNHATVTIAAHQRRAHFWVSLGILPGATVPFYRRNSGARRASGPWRGAGRGHRPLLRAWAADASQSPEEHLGRCGSTCW